MQVPKSKPHANVRISITHRDDEKHLLYDDIARIDGTPLAVGRGRGGHVSLRLPPGPHRIQLSSAQLRYDFERDVRDAGLA